MAVIGASAATAAVPDVTGETFGRAAAILKSQGYKPIFGGSIGNDLPQSQCVVLEQQPAGRNVRLRLDCNLQPGQEQPKAPNTHSLVPPGGSVPGGTAGQQAPADPGRPTPGAGTVTVTPRPVG
ncbi:hypothetical protein AWB99_09550 [Mycolicibacterium confluentis]|nr:hypothetical protein AWB99_09550 [Mycolicibacterium confluentis]